jgi:hypothetical protein
VASLVGDAISALSEPRVRREALHRLDRCPPDQARAVFGDSPSLHDRVEFVVLGSQLDQEDKLSSAIMWLVGRQLAGPKADTPAGGGADSTTAAQA